MASDSSNICSKIGSLIGPVIMESPGPATSGQGAPTSKTTIGGERGGAGNET
jgi:hypothetical protein